ncbi:transposase [Paracoccus sp. pheM1]|uniref:transposase n=1 Tax=Paracoccus sp. pheM1 TaxID=2831675 RepID=UPI001BDB9461|nr:transposase [Paracoccus sp. pheM1]MBT0779135.1 transposase [Paracoccus sp. pheM1]MBT0779156.1 transposase [Paracoccus sp. pheM1]MBT0779734.1 transposase [Paracoccus sp. pheM1]MBT0780665.1 transposase [Paracoccus sp. pheM1]MBT0782301.1 transposase [Paracoccus sp. pheM1]
MLGRKERGQQELFITGSLRGLIPDDHVLVRVDQVLDLGWLRAEVADLYCADNGRSGIDPEVAMRLMLAGFLLGIVQDRRLMREAQVNLAIRWFVGYALHEALPDHSSLTRIRQRWGADVFRQIFIHVVRQCQAAGLISTETVHIDASLIRANVSMDALVSRHLDAVEAAHDDANGAERDARTSGKFKKLCRTDPDATMATSSKAPLRPAYKQHTAVDDFAGVVVDVEIVTGEEHDTGRFDERLEAIEATLGVTPGRITADRLYGIGRIYAALEDRRIAAVIPPLRAPRRKGAQGFPTERFKFDPHHDVVRCPARRRLTPRNVTKSGQWYRADRHDCARCPLKAQCLPRGAPSRRVHIVTNHAAILRARRKRLAWGKDGHAIYTRHRWRVEGTHGTAKTLHGLARAIRRGLENMRIQALLTAIAMNLKKLAAAMMLLLCSIIEMRAVRPNPAAA